MNIGIHLNCCTEKLPVEEQIRFMKKYGFSTTFCMADLEEIDTVIEAVQKAGIEFENLHAPFRTINAMWGNYAGIHPACQRPLSATYAGGVLQTCWRGGEAVRRNGGRV